MYKLYSKRRPRSPGRIPEAATTDPQPTGPTQSVDPAIPARSPEAATTATRPVGPTQSVDPAIPAPSPEAATTAPRPVGPTQSESGSGKMSCLQDRGGAELNMKAEPGPHAHSPRRIHYKGCKWTCWVVITKYLQDIGCSVYSL